MSSNHRSSGIVGESILLFGSLSRHLQALASLAGDESKAAVGLYVRLLIALGAALILAAFGYIFIILFVAFAIQALFGFDWIWITLGLAAFHLLAAFLCIAYVKTHYRTPIFSATAAEIRKDLDALRRSETAPEP